MADATVLEAVERSSCGFDSRLWHHTSKERTTMIQQEQAANAVKEALQRMTVETIKTATVVQLWRGVYYNKQNVACYAYTGKEKGCSIFIWREPSEPNWWFVEHYAGLSEHYWGTRAEIALWLYKRGIYPLFGDSTDGEVLDLLAGESL
jgi:hypothetical protein